MKKSLTKEIVLSSSSGWIAFLLNFFPGLGTGYIYQRRWRAYLITLFSIFAWTALGLILRNDSFQNKDQQIIGFIGLLFISFITALESKYTHQKTVKFLDEEKVSLQKT